PWKSLGCVLTERTVKPQRLQINLSITTLHDLQKGLGSMNWIQPLLGISNSMLK
ncbi:POK8 protein, partial [Bucorvus abyssinicus]|nr:POK8 protein [Bucorvus abyssinicus]